MWIFSGILATLANGNDRWMCQSNGHDQRNAGLERIVSSNEVLLSLQEMRLLLIVFS